MSQLEAILRTASRPLDLPHSGVRMLTVNPSDPANDGVFRERLSWRPLLFDLADRPGLGAMDYPPVMSAVSG